MQLFRSRLYYGPRNHTILDGDTPHMLDNDRAFNYNCELLRADS